MAKAVVGAVVSSAVSSAFGGKASSAQSAAADQAAQVQREIYQQNREDLTPYRTTGYAANNRLSQLLGLDTFDRDAIAQSLGLSRAGSNNFTPGQGITGVQPAMAIGGPGMAEYGGIELNPYRLTPQQRAALEPYATGPETPSVRGEVRRTYAFPNDVMRSIEASPNNATIPNYLQNQLIEYAMGNRGGIGATSSPSTGTSGGTTANTSDIEAQIDAEIARLKGDPSFGSLSKNFSLQDFQADPGYQFRKDEGNKALEAMQSKRGNLFSGLAMKEAADFNSGLASQEFGAAYGRDDNNKNRLYNMLAGVSNQGMGAVNSGISAGQNYANQASNIAGQLGNVQAAQAINQGNNISSMIGNIFSGASQYSSRLPWQAPGNVNPFGGFY